MNDIFMLKDAVEMWQKRGRSFGDYSVTTLLKPPQMVMLEKRYADRVERPLESMISAFIGTGVHSIFEENLKLKSIIEPRYDIERTITDKIHDRIISGRFDALWDSKHLYDFKTCKVWKKVFDPDMIEWHEQLNIYAYMLKRRGLDIQSINIIAVYLDWQKMRAIRDKDYPQAAVCEYKLELWADAKTEHFLKSRIELMKKAEDVQDEFLPPCTDEERWMRHENGRSVVYALMSRADATRALKIFDTEAEAKEFASTAKGCTPGVSFIEARFAQAKRCEDFCSIKGYCNQFKSYYLSKINSNLTERINI